MTKQLIGQCFIQFQRRIQNPVKHLTCSFSETKLRLKAVTIFERSSILDVWKGSEFQIFDAFEFS